MLCQTVFEHFLKCGSEHFLKIAGTLEHIHAEMLATKISLVFVYVIVFPWFLEHFEAFWADLIHA
jgi:hypothetical protein